MVATSSLVSKEIGGIEYKALRLLSYIVPLVSKFLSYIEPSSSEGTVCDRCTAVLLHPHRAMAGEHVEIRPSF